MTLAVLEETLRPFREPAKNTLKRFLMTNFPPQPILTESAHGHYSATVGFLLKTMELGGFSPSDEAAVAEFIGLVSPFIQDYENRRHPMGAPDAVDMLKFLMRQHGLNQTDLAADLGGQSVVSAVLNRKRGLNARQIARLSAKFHITPSVFFPASRGDQTPNRL